MNYDFFWVDLYRENNFDGQYSQWTHRCSFSSNLFYIYNLSLKWTEDNFLYSFRQHLKDGVNSPNILPFYYPQMSGWVDFQWQGQQLLKGFLSTDQTHDYALLFQLNNVT